MSPAMSPWLQEACGDYTASPPVHRFLCFLLDCLGLRYVSIPKRLTRLWPPMLHHTCQHTC